MNEFGNQSEVSLLEKRSSVKEIFSGRMEIYMK